MSERLDPAIAASYYQSAATVANTDNRTRWMVIAAYTAMRQRKWIVERKEAKRSLNGVFAIDTILADTPSDGSNRPGHIPPTAEIEHPFLSPDSTDQSKVSTIIIVGVFCHPNRCSITLKGYNTYHLGSWNILRLSFQELLQVVNL